MASRVKNMFHRKKDEDAEEPRPRPRAPVVGNGDPAVRTSLYESTTAAGLPQTGDYPIKGNDSSVMLQAGRKSSVRSLRSRRSSSRGSQYNTPHQAPQSTHYDGSRPNPRFSPPPSDAPGSGSYNPYQDPSLSTGVPDDRHKRWSRSPLPQEFANLSLGDSQAPTTVPQTVTTTRTGQQQQYGNRGAPQSQIKPDQNNGNTFRAAAADCSPQEPIAKRIAPPANGYGVRSKPGDKSVNRLDGHTPSASIPYQDSNTNDLKTYAHDAPREQGEYDAALVRQKSIPRKQIGTSAQVPYPSAESSAIPSSHISHGRQKSASKSLPSTSLSSGNGYEARKMEAPPQPASILNRSRPITRDSAKPRDGQQVVNRAKSNTYDTEVIEKVAPAVVHENVSKDVHHIREEVVTREIDTHDIYHRILPVVDVEVLPPRHFLPVEGGGLVEVSASEVPGRGHNWVIAETASKIPSDQAAPQGRRRFTAREFPGREGDAVRYMSPEGYEKIEETWVHPPELEEGARLTGQSWPMVFGEESGGNEAIVTPTSNATKRKSPRKGPAIQANSAPRAGGLSRPTQSLT